MRERKTTIKADLHIHTVSSGHGYSTVREICEAARARGLEMVGIADHGPAMPGAAHAYHFANLFILPREIHGVKVLKSAECNVVDIDGNLDLDERILRTLDIVHAGFHILCGFDNRSREENTQALINAMKRRTVDVIVHPGNPMFPLDYEKVVEAASRCGVALEVNNASFTVVRKGSEENCRKIIRLAKEAGTSICVVSDAHDASLVGVLDRALDMLEELEFPWSHVINRDSDSVLEFLKSRGKELKP